MIIAFTTFNKQQTKPAKFGACADFFFKSNPVKPIYVLIKNPSTSNMFVRYKQKLSTRNTNYTHWEYLYKKKKHQARVGLSFETVCKVFERF